MYPQIVKTDNILKSIRECGLRYYVNRLVQDGLGDYFYVDAERIEPDEIQKISWEYITETISGGMSGKINYLFRFKIVPIPRALAFFIIDALRLKAQAKALGDNQYEDGPHGGTLRYFVKEADGFKEIQSDMIRIEEL